MSISHQRERVGSRTAFHHVSVFFVYSLKLLYIREKLQTFGTLQSSNKNVTGYLGQDLGAILDLNTELDHFLKDLPAHLQVDDSAMRGVAKGSNACFELQKRVLRARLVPSIRSRL